MSIFDSDRSRARTPGLKRRSKQSSKGSSSSGSSKRSSSKSKRRRKLLRERQLREGMHRAAPQTPRPRSFFLPIVVGILLGLLANLCFDVVDHGWEESKVVDSLRKHLGGIGTSLTSFHPNRPDTTVDRTTMVINSTEIDNEFYGSAEWWNPSAPLRALHDMNPFRLAYFEGVIRQWGGSQEASVWRKDSKVETEQTSRSKSKKDVKKAEKKKKKSEEKGKKDDKKAVEKEEDKKTEDKKAEDKNTAVDTPRRLRIADIGSGGGIFTEALLRSPSGLQTAGFRQLEGINGDDTANTISPSTNVNLLPRDITGVDRSGASLDIARKHFKTTEFYASGAAREGVEKDGPKANTKDSAASTRNAASTLRYQLGTADTTNLSSNSFDVVSMTDVLEHIPDLPSTIKEVSRILKPGGLFLFDTIERTYTSWVFLIFLAQHLLGLCPPGTHDWRLFVNPGELEILLRENGFGGLGSSSASADAGINSSVSESPNIVTVDGLLVDLSLKENDGPQELEPLRDEEIPTQELPRNIDGIDPRIVNELKHNVNFSRGVGTDSRDNRDNGRADLGNLGTGIGFDYFDCELVFHPTPPNIAQFAQTLGGNILALTLSGVLGTVELVKNYSMSAGSSSVRVASNLLKKSLPIAGRFADEIVMGGTITSVEGLGRVGRYVVRELALESSLQSDGGDSEGDAGDESTVLQQAVATIKSSHSALLTFLEDARERGRDVVGNGWEVVLTYLDQLVPADAKGVETGEKAASKSSEANGGTGETTSAAKVDTAATKATADADTKATEASDAETKGVGGGFNDADQMPFVTMEFFLNRLGPAQDADLMSRFLFWLVPRKGQFFGYAVKRV